MTYPDIDEVLNGILWGAYDDKLSVIKNKI
jgi:hypothetical protein